MSHNNKRQKKLISLIRTVRRDLNRFNSHIVYCFLFSLLGTAYIAAVFEATSFDPSAVNYSVVEFALMISCFFSPAALFVMCVFWRNRPDFSCLLKSRGHGKLKIESFTSKPFVFSTVILNAVLIGFLVYSVVSGFYESLNGILATVIFWIFVLLSVVYLFLAGKFYFQVCSLYKDLEAELEKAAGILASEIRMYNECIKDEDGKIYYKLSDCLISVDQDGNIESANVPTVFSDKLYFKKSSGRVYITAKDLYNDLETSLEQLVANIDP